MKNPKIGGHISTAGGLDKLAKRANAIGAECVQIFAGSPRRYEVKKINKREVEEYKKDKLEISPVYIHASYLINLASENEEIKKKSIKSLKEAINYANYIDAEGVVYHPGSPRGGSREKALEREIRAVTEILQKTDRGSLIIENTAGVKKIGTTPEEIGSILKKINSKRLKVCIDTAHSIESGIINSFSLKNIEKWLLRWEREVGLKNISLLHINDSLTKAGSHHDRHANIGEGFVGIEGFKNLMKFDDIRNIPWILEVPGFNNEGPDKKNVDILKNIRKVAF